MPIYKGRNLQMKERTKRFITVSGSVLTALSIALALLAFVTVTSLAATDTGMPSMSDIIPGEDGTSAISLPEGGNVDSDVLTPDDSTRTPSMTNETPTTTRPATTTARPSTTTSPDGTETGMLEEEGGSILGAIIAVIVVVAIILVVIALIPRKKR